MSTREGGELCGLQIRDVDLDRAVRPPADRPQLVTSAVLNLAHAIEPQSSV